MNKNYLLGGLVLFLGIGIPIALFIRRQNKINKLATPLMGSEMFNALAKKGAKHLTSDNKTPSEIQSWAKNYSILFTKDLHKKYLNSLDKKDSEKDEMEKLFWQWANESSNVWQDKKVYGENLKKMLDLKIK